MGVFDRLKEQPSGSGGVFGRLNARSSLETAERFTDPSLSVDALEQEKLAQIKQFPEPAAREVVYEPRAAMESLDMPSSLDFRKTPIMQQASQIPIEPERPGRDIPVLGQGLQALDWIGEKVEPVANVARSLYTPGAGLGNVAGAYNAVGGLLNKVAPKLGGSLGGRVAQEVIKETAVGVPVSAGQALTNQTTDLGEVAKQGAIGGALGAVTGGAGPLIGAGANKVVSNAIERYLGPVLKNVDSRGKTPAEEAFESVSKAGKIPNKLTPLGNEAQLDKVMTRVKPIVEQRLAVPYENPTELARYVQQGLKNQGADVSLNEIRKVSYDGLVEMADEIKRTANTYDEAVRASKGLGYDLPNLLDGKTPSLRQRIASDASDRAYGVYPEKLPKVIEPITKGFEEAPVMKQNWFTNLFGNQGVGISAFGSNKQISKAPLTTEQQIVKNPLKKDAKGVVNQTAAITRATYQNFVDHLDPLKNISPKAYEKAMDATRANNIANVIVDDKFVTPEGVVIGEGLTSTFQKVGRGQTKKFLDYIVLRHAKTRMERNERVYAESLEMTTDKVQERLNMYNKQYPEFDAIAKEWDQFHKNIREVYGVNEDLLSKEMAQHLEEKNPHYASMMRQFSTSEKFASPLSMGAKPAFSGQRAPIKEVSKTGSIRRIVDPRRSAIEATGAWVNAAMRNRVMKSLVDAVKNDVEGMKEIVEIVQRPKGQPNLKELLEDEGMEGFLESLNSDFNQLFKRTNLEEDNVVRTMIKGEPVYLKVKNPEAVKALIGMGPEQSNLVMDIFGGFSKATKYGATGALAPMFAVKSLTMDVAQSLIQSKNPVTHMWDLGHAIMSSLANTLPKNTPGFEALRALAQDYKRSGGEYSAALRGDRPLNKSVLKMDRNPILSGKGLAVNAGRLIASPFKALNKVADISENVNRMAAAKGELRRLGGQKTPDNVMKAMGEAREITTNYSRKGNQSQQIEKFVPYNNAAVQGMYRFATAWKKNPIKTAAMVGGAVMLPKAYEYLQFHEDPDYQALPAREKYRNLIVKKNEDGTFIKVPMPPEYTALGAFMVDSLESIRDNNHDAFKGASDAMTNAYTPPLASGLAQGATQGGGIEQSLKGGFQSTVLGPSVSVVSNQSFTGAPIESMAVTDRSPKFRYDEKTSAVAKWIGSNLGYSPMKTDYLLRSYGGDPARLILPLTSQVGQGSTRNTLLRNFIVDPTFTNNLTNDYYAGKEKLTQAYRDNEEVDKELPVWFNDDLRKMVSSTAKNSPSSRLSDLTKEKKAINLDDSLTLKEKSDRVKDVQRQMNEIYLEINSKMTEAGVPIPNR